MKSDKTDTGELQDWTPPEWLRRILIKILRFSAKIEVRRMYVHAFLTNEDNPDAVLKSLGYTHIKNSMYGNGSYFITIINSSHRGVESSCIPIWLAVRGINTYKEEV